MMGKDTVMKKIVLCGLLVLFVLPLSSFADEVNVYSARKEALIRPLLDCFSKASGITVNLVTGKADTLLSRLQHEDRNSPADLFITVDVGRLSAYVCCPECHYRLKMNCPSCGKLVKTNWDICPFCEENLSKVNEPNVTN